ncbi:MAG: APC family permease [Candidatus Aenigmatarchaeota archaeon]
MPGKIPLEKHGIEHRRLKRSLGLFELTAYGVGIILGAGIYALIGKAAAIAGPALWISFLIGAVVASLTGLSYAELGTMYPKEAAEYVYTRKAFRGRRLPFLIGWLIIFVALVAAATVSLGFGGYLEALTGIPMAVGAGILIVLLSLLNFWGISESAKANIVFTLIELGGLLLIVFLGAPYFGSVNYFEMPMGFGGVFAAAVLIFFAYIGFEDVVNVSEETRAPRRIIPKALILSIIITTVLYILVAIASVSVLPWNTLGVSTAPLADVANAAMPGSSFAFSIIALFATANTVLILLIVDSRMIWGMARAGSFPKILSRIHAKRRTPWVSIFTMMFIALLFVSAGDIRTIAELTDFGAFIVFMATNISLIVLRYKKPGMRRPFKVPGNIGRLPVPATLGAIFCFVMLFNFGLHVVLSSLGVIAAGFIVYELMLRRGIIR